ncbi:Uu.00g132990.m01.CDS01 [Anthostomella pinea]|uniref:Uu.00g132990.m01.CDS01 n=1 Tax=Anthostomella pinea TaxID=933095 RepID=A0AAI8YMT8_9PEZI|nr:Uu.00g132990.m01.CDS01 [Anthostomella pinea]
MPFKLQSIDIHVRGPTSFWETGSPKIDRRQNCLYYLDYPTPEPATWREARKLEQAEQIIPFPVSFNVPGSAFQERSNFLLFRLVMSTGDDSHHCQFDAIIMAFFCAVGAQPSSDDARQAGLTGNAHHRLGSLSLSKR